MKIKEIIPSRLFDVANTLFMLLLIVIMLYSFFDALIYLNEKSRYPLQIHLRNIIIVGTDIANIAGSDSGEIAPVETLKYATIMVATLPILFVYPLPIIFISITIRIFHWITSPIALTFQWATSAACSKKRWGSNMWNMSPK